ncbi:MAG: protein kinase [Myxococcota bacterium]
MLADSDAPTVYGKYQLLDRLAMGGMAEVFKAKSHGVEGFEKILVIKRILPELSRNPQFVEMFINEAKIAVTLSHANIVQVFDLGKADDTYFIAMEYVAGYDLSYVLRRGRELGRALPPELAVYIVSEIAKALDYAHRRRDAHLRPLSIVHRDVSPQNVLLSFEGEVKLTDFGIAKARTTVEDDSEMGVLKGKYAYMAPEQANGREVDARTDLFALGTVLYEALSGKNPFSQESAYDTLQKVRRGEAAPLQQANPKVPAELSHIVAVAMSPGIDSRHANAGKLYEDLIQFLYSSGRRVGAHDLSRYLDELREATSVDEDSQIERAFEADGVVHEGDQATPAEAPASKTGRRTVTPSGTPLSTGSGARVPSSSHLPRAERRDATALAILSSRNDQTPESTVRALIHRFGGQVVEQVTAADGRWLVIAFGVVDPDGRDTEAGARCALRVARASTAASDNGAEPTLRLALHSGRVLVDLSGEIVRDERYDMLINGARRLAGRARRGHVLCTGTAARSLKGPFQLDGEGAPEERIFRVGGERSVAEAVGKFIGRRDELRRVGEVLAMANKGRRQILGVVGEAGTGKSRMLLETVRRLRLGGHDVGVYLATVVRQGRDVPLAAMQEMLRVVLGIDELDPEPIIRDKVARVRELGLNQPESRAIELALGLSRDSEHQPGSRALRAALARIATRLAEDRLTVFAFDGVEWMDDESQFLLDALLQDALESRLAVVLAYRPGFVHAWSDLRGYSEIEVGPLSDEDVVSLAASRLQAEEVALPLLRDVTAKSGGNPLYVEEYLKALQDAGAVEIAQGEVVYRPEVAEVEVPKTLRGIVAARVARLGPVQRHVLQVASVVGSRFGSDILGRVAGEDASTIARALGVLESRGIIARVGSSEYSFAHELVGEVLRDGLTLEARRELHRAVAVALEQLYPQRVDEMAERLAEHCQKAGDLPKAIDYLERAADRLESEQVLDGSIINLVRALEFQAQVPTPDRDRALSFHRRIGELSFRSRDLEKGAERMATALGIAEGLGRDEYVARFSMMRGRLLANANRFAEGRKWLGRARDVARQLGNRDLLRDITLATAEAYARNGEYSSAIGLLREGLALSHDTGDLAAQIRCLIPLSLAYAATGERRTSLETLEEARRLAGIAPDRYTDCELLKNEAIIHYYSRAYPEAVDASARALELAKEYGFFYEASVNAHNLGEAYLRLGDYKRAFAQLRYSYELAREHGFVKVEYINLRVLGFIDAVRFRSEQGRRRIIEALEHAEENNYVWDLVQSRYLLAIADSVLGNVEEARGGLRETMRLAAEHGDTRYHDDAQEALRALEAGQPVPLPS